MSNSVTSETATNNEKAKKTQTLINNEDENLTIHGYKSNFGKSAIVCVFYFLTAGLLRLLFHWFPIWKLYATHSKCFLSIADKILIVDKYRGKYTTHYVEKIKILPASDQRDAVLSSTSNTLIAYLENGTVLESPQIRMVSCKHSNYIWNEGTSKFVKLCGIDQKRKRLDFYDFKGLTQTQQLTRGITYGKNETLVPVKTVLALLLLEALTPFYIFQVFTLIVWFAEGYYYYMIAIVTMSVFGITSSIIQTLKNQQTLREFHSLEKVTVCRGNGQYEEISSCNLVPGDVIEISKGSCVMQCDAVLLNGICIVNESMLTGESVPVTKTPIPKTNSIYDVKEDSFHTLYCGTKVIQTQTAGVEKAFAVVLRTGFLTTKGKLVRSILYPPPSDFKFDQDSYKFIGILTIIAIAGFLYTIISKLDRSIAASDVILKALDVITIVIPPALPAAMTIGKLYALSRLKIKQIFCLNSRVINVSGSIDCVCFDKTGTLTEDGLEMWGVVTTTGRNLDNPKKRLEVFLSNSDIVKGMATCHSIVVLDKQLLGDPLDLKVFESTGWLLDNNGNLVTSNNKDRDASKVQLEIYHRFQFVSSLQRMSVIVKDMESSNFQVYCKGSPEMIASLSKPATIPSDLDEKLKEYAGKGYRVIAMASKPIHLDNSMDTQHIQRADIEQDLNFLGLIILENCLKPETAGVISVLRKANLKTIMITGDNFLTAISVAKECGIISNDEVIVEVQVNHTELGQPVLSLNANISQNTEGINYNKLDVNLESGSNKEYRFAVTGVNWTLVHRYFPERVMDLVEKGVVFARMSGKQKQQLVQELQKLGYYVAMCGDGANDCGALKAAHVGISLSEEESSIASPFTSKTPNITCVPEIIKEGRAALTTSIGVFKFMICYSLIQFTSVIVLYGIDSNLTQIQFLFIDLCLALNFVSTFGKTNAYNGSLHKNRPLTSLLCFTSISSIMLQMLLVICFQILAYKLIQTYDWFVPFQFNPESEHFYTCYENYAVFSVSIFQYIILAIAFSKGKPFRMPMYSNKEFSASLILMIVVCFYIISYPAEWILSLLEFIVPPKLDILALIMGLVVANLICSLLAEDVFVGYVFNSKIWENILHRIRPSKKCIDIKRSMQLPFNLVHYGNSRSSITFENSGRKASKNGEYGYINGVFYNTERDY